MNQIIYTDDQYKIRALAEELNDIARRLLEPSTDTFTAQDYLDEVEDENP